MGTRLEQYTTAIDLVFTEEANSTDPPLSSEEFAERVLDHLDEMRERLVFIEPGIEDEDDQGTTKWIELMGPEEVGPFIKLCSWDPAKRHVALKPFEDAKRVRVTVEVDS